MERAASQAERPGILIMNEAGTRAILVKQRGSAMADLLEQSLGAAGVRIMAVETAYEAIVEAERSAAPYRYIILGVDHFGREEFRLIPVVRREWPQATLVAYHSPGFEYKGALADLVGADLVLAGLDGISVLLEDLGQKSPPAAPVPEPEAEASTPGDERSESKPGDEAVRESPGRESPGRESPRSPPAPHKVAPAPGQALTPGDERSESPGQRSESPGRESPGQPPPARVELSAEELRLLLAEEDEP